MPKNGSPRWRSTISNSAPPVWPTWRAPYHSATASKYGRDEHLDVVVDARRQSVGVLDDEPGAAVQRSPDPERHREPVTALDAAVAGAQQAERRARTGGQHQVAGQWRAVPVEQADGLAFGHPGTQSLEEAADPVRGLAGGCLEHGQLLDLVDDPQARRPASMSRSTAFSTWPGRPGQPAQLVDDERRQRR